MLITAIPTEHPQLSRYIFLRGPQVIRPLKARSNVRPESTLNASTHRCPRPRSCSQDATIQSRGCHVLATGLDKAGKGIQDKDAEAQILNQQSDYVKSKVGGANLWQPVADTWIRATCLACRFLSGH